MRVVVALGWSRARLAQGSVDVVQQWSLRAMRLGRCGYISRSLNDGFEYPPLGIGIDPDQSDIFTSMLLETSF